MITPLMSDIRQKHLYISALGLINCPMNGPQILNRNIVFFSNIDKLPCKCSYLLTLFANT